MVPAHGGPRLLAHSVFSQVKLHAEYGGVVPELASRDHIRRIIPLIRNVLATAGVASGLVDVVAFTKGPGLAGALLVGAGVACAAAASLGKPALGIHHLEGHLLSPFLSAEPPKFPFVTLLVSGGHTQLLEVRDIGDYRLLGDTIDDAAGEAFDKSAKLLGLDYPGGPALELLAQSGDAGQFVLPRPMLHRNTLDFSFAGLKTAVRTQAIRLTGEQHAQARADLAASTQEAIIDVLVRKAMDAIDQTGLCGLVVAGGVGANSELRTRLTAECSKRQVRLDFPQLELCTDNGAMIALAAAMRLQRGIADLSTNYAFDVMPRWPLTVTRAEAPRAAINRC